MTEDHALIWIDFLHCRLFGWDIAMAIDPKTGRNDHRTRRNREAGELMRDISFNMPSFEVLLAAVMADRDIVAMWPEAMRETVRFRIDHKVPRDHNEPTSDLHRAGKREHQSEDWPDWIVGHGEPATVDNHPPFPPRSELYIAWKADCRAGLPASEVIGRGAARRAERPYGRHA